MKKILLHIIALIITITTYAYEVSGVAVNSETGDPLPGFDLLLTYPEGGVAASTVTAGDGSFLFTDVANGTYVLEFSTYPDPIILNGDYFLLTEYEDQIVVDGADISGINFQIPPHETRFTLTGQLYDAVTEDLITIQDFQVQGKLKYYVEFFTDYATDSGTYILEDLPDWTYELSIFENDYYHGLDTEIIIDPEDPDTVVMDFYLQPKEGVTVSGVLLDSTTNEPIKRTGRTIVIQAINSFFTQTDSTGAFTFINIPPGSYANIHVSYEDTAYVNTTQSEILGFNVPDSGVNDVELYQKPWVSIHEITSDAYSFEPGETETISFNITNDDLSYGSIWGVNLVFPEGMNVLNTTSFFNTGSSNEVFERLPDCSSESKIAWEGWHWTGVPHFSSAEGNLEMLNESAYTNATVQFADTMNMDSVSVFYEVYYAKHCFSIQPFSYGTIIMDNEDVITGNAYTNSMTSEMYNYPNPATDHTEIHITLDRAMKGKVMVYNISGQTVMNTGAESYQKGSNKLNINTSRLKNGVYYYTFLTNELKLTGKFIVSR